MDHFPLEIWDQIFAFACIDSAQTGRSLSLVSRYFRDVSRLSQYQSVSLTKSKHILIFRQTLFHAPLKARRIKYLHVCCPNVFLDVSDEEDSDYVETPMNISSPSGSDESMEIGSDSSGEEYEGPPNAEELQELLDDSLAVRQSEHSPLPQGSNDDYDDNDDNDDDDWYLHFWDDFDEDIHNADKVVLEAFRDILHEASSSLLILSVNWTSFRPLLIEALLIPLPNLVELHLCRTLTSYGFGPETEDAAPTLFPRLRRLHVFGYSDYRLDSFGRGLARFDQSIGRIAPSLTHIRMPYRYVRYALAKFLTYGTELNRDA